MLDLPYTIQVTVAVFVLVGLVAWSVWQKRVHGDVPQPVWQTPEYLRYNRGVNYGDLS